MDQQQRDKRGRFVKGNTVSVSNKGNTYPKWGNSNAKKHGLHAAHFPPVIKKGNLYVYISRVSAVVFRKGEWKRNDNGRIQIFGEKVLFLQSIGMPLEETIDEA